MAHYRSRLYQELREKTAADYSRSSWPAARRWLARVGLPRLTAENGLGDADALLRSINLSSFRNKPDAARAIVAAREAVREAYYEVARDNWADFKGEKR